MKLKDGLILRQVAGQYVIVPTGQRVREIPRTVFISASGAYLWDYMKNHEFQPEDLVERIMDHYSGARKENVKADVDKFLKVLADNLILDDGKRRGMTVVKIPRGSEE